MEEYQQKVLRDFYAQAVTFVTFFDVAFLEDIYTHVTKANRSDSEWHHRIIQICQLV